MDTRPAPSGAPPRRTGRLRIGIEAHVVGRRQTGNERVVSNLIRAIRTASDHDLVVYFTDQETAKDWEQEGLPRTTIHLLRPANPLVRIPFGLPLAARRDRLDVLLAHVNRPPLAPCPVVTLVHDVAFARYPEYFSRFERTYMNRTIPASMRRSKAIVTVSGFTRDEVVELYGIRPERITVAQNGVEARFSDPTARPSLVDPPFFLAIGNLQPRKNLVTLLRAYRRLVATHPEVRERLVIVGQERLQAEELYREADDLRRTGRVLFTGYISDDDLVGLLQRATAFAYPSVYEGFGLPPVEAMAAGTPALVADIPVMREVVGDAALRLPPTGVEAWTDGLIRVATDPALRDRLIDEGRTRAARYTWDAAARTIITVLERVAGTRK